MAHGLSCSAACGIFLDQGSNPCLLHWQADSQPLRHQESPNRIFIYKISLQVSPFLHIYYLLCPSGIPMRCFLHGLKLSSMTLSYFPPRGYFAFRIFLIFLLAQLYISSSFSSIFLSRIIEVLGLYFTLSSLPYFQKWTSLQQFIIMTLVFLPCFVSFGFLSLPYWTERVGVPSVLFIFAYLPPRPMPTPSWQLKQCELKMGARPPYFSPGHDGML